MKLALLGDIALFGCCTTKAYFKVIGEYLSNFDYVVGNLETPFSAAKKTSGAKSAYICADPISISILDQLHINAVTLANNHMFDYGKEGYELTKKLLSEAGIVWFGAEGRELHVDIKGNSISFAGFCCYTTNPLKCVDYGGYGVNAYNVSQVEGFVKRSKKEGFLPIIAVHAGLEHVNYPSIDHIMAARKLSKIGPFVYYGHHPHVVQGVEDYSGSLLAYSLGNFCFDDIYTDLSKSIPLVELTDNNRIGMILELDIENNAIKNWKEQIIHIGDENEGISLIEEPHSITDYNLALRTCVHNQGEYNANRNAILNSRLAERKSKRTVVWFLKRLRPRYFRLLFDMKKNLKLYKENVQKYI